MTERLVTPAPEHQQPRPEPRIYVASLSDYNAGQLHGVWLEADDTVEGLQEGIDVMLATSPTSRAAEEWAIHDYEDFGPVELSEFESLERISVLASGIVEHGPAFASWWALLEPDGTPDASEFEEQFLGEFATITDYAEDVLGDLGIEQLLDEIPEGLRPYVHIDAHAFGRDLELGGAIATHPSPQGDLYIFGLDG